jgi:uncharacterized protein (TIGR03437 family)
MHRASRGFILLFLSLSFLPTAVRADEPKEDGERGENPRGREQWFTRRHLNRSGQVGARERLLALQARDKMRAAGNVAFPGQNWQQIGPQPENTEDQSIAVSAGRVTALAVDPRNSQVVYAGAAEGGVWKTLDGGNTWMPLTDQQVTLATGSIAIAPSNPDTVYVGTGELNYGGDNYFGVGILKSTDDGTTWSYYEGGFTGLSIGSLAVSPTDSNTVLAAGDGGVYLSSDGGMTWANVIAASECSSVAFSPTDPNSAWAGVGTPLFQDPSAGIYHSTDGGQTWQTVNITGLPAANTGRVSLAIAPSNPLMLYVGVSPVSTSDTTTLVNPTLGVFTSQDGGNTWTANTGLTTGTCAESGNCVTYTGNWYDNALAVSPSDPQTVVGGGFSIEASQDAGSTWTEIGTAYEFVHTDQHAFAFSADGTVLYAGNDGGVFVSTNIGTATPTWTGTGSTMAITQFYPGISILPTEPSVTVGGTQDNGTLAYGGNLKWTYIECGDGGGTYLSPQNPSLVYVTCAPPNAVWFSNNGAKHGSFLPRMGAIPQSEAPFVGVLAGDPSDPLGGTVYWGGNSSVWETTNQASSWADVTSNLNPSPFLVSAIGVVSPDGNTVIFGDEASDIYCTQNAKTPPIQWTGCAPQNLAYGVISAVTADPMHPGGAYLTEETYTGGSHILYTSNAGTSWTDLTGDLPDVPVSALAVDEATAFLYIGTDVGVFMSADNGGHWQPLGNGMPNTVVMDVKFYQSARVLRAATHGRSMWDISLPIQPPTLGAGGIVNSANYGAVAPGSIAAVFGAQMTDGTVSSSALPLPLDLAGAALSFGTVSAPLFFASAGQLNVQVPWETPVGSSPATLTFGLQTSSTPATIAQYAPGIFTLNASGGGQGIIVNLDYTYAAPTGTIPGATPAQPGGYVVMYCTGLGPVTNQPSTGSPAGFSPLAQAIGQVTVSIGGVTTTPEFAGLTPGAVGLYQVNVQVPQSVTPGDAVPVSVTAGGVTSNTVTMAVQ